jgi:tryptophan-rich sensory protein
MNNTQSHSRWPQAGLNVAALAVTLVLNTLATTLPLGGRTTAEISDSFNPRFVPAGYVFSIWGLIYLALIGFAVFQALPAQQTNQSVRATGYWFALTCLANSLWIVLWQYGYTLLTLPVMLVLLAALIVLYRRLAALPAVNRATRWLVHAPFSLYLGWISVATIANASAVLVHLGWDGRPLNPVVWAVVMIAAAAGLSLLMSFRHRDAIYSGVIAWALIGIVVKQADSAPIVIACAAALAAVGAGLVLSRRSGGKPALALGVAR